MISDLSKIEIPKGEEIKAMDIRIGIYNLIKESHPEFDRDSIISVSELNSYRRKYLSFLIMQEQGELGQIHQDVVEMIKNNASVTSKLSKETTYNLSFGQKIADKIAAFGGSWTFIVSFFSFIVIWMLSNLIVISKHPFDPFPFILLNLILSCIAAIQAPIIMMSQNRQEQKDRIRSENDYKINVKAELEIKLLNEKIDHLLIHQNNRLVEIQEIQVDYLEDLTKQIKGLKSNNH
jgi:uncharacterized membrane protein